MTTMILSIAVVLAGFYSLCHCAPAVSVESSEGDVCSVLLAHPPYSHLISFSPLSGVIGLSRPSLARLYTATLELWQGAELLKQELICRTGVSVPPPHHHCFLEERSEEDYVYNSTTLIMDAHRLAADLCLLTPFIAPLQNALCYEVNNHSGEFESDIRSIQGQFNAILEVISNITGVSVTTQSPPTTGPPAEEGGDSVDGSRSPMVSRSHRDTRQANELPSVATTQAPSIPTDSSDFNLLNQRRPRRQAPADEPVATATTMTTTPPPTNDKCLTPESSEYQFITVYELMVSLWYLVSDLSKMSMQ